MPADQQQLVERIAEVAGDRGLKIAAAESLTCGRVLSALGAGPNASSWLAGGVVAYDEEVKFGLLGVTRGPVITALCARELATGVAKVLDADVAIGITGCGGPDPEEGQPPGTVYIAVAADGEVHESHRRVDTDEPDAILDEVTTAALRLLADTIA
ncbi:CinA family protein [Nocardioides sp. MAHUQ-72]|uniref:CinA family protein n=1 Tax=unclassified Nocardioides TaxID=2615069 RepID=UPI00360BBC12